MNIDSFNANMMSKYTDINSELMTTGRSWANSSMLEDKSGAISDAIAFSELLKQQKTVIDLTTNLNTAIHKIAEKSIETMRR